MGSGWRGEARVKGRWVPGGEERLGLREDGFRVERRG